MKVSSTVLDNDLLLVIEGMLTIDVADDLAAEFKAALAKKKKLISLDFEAVKKVDVSFFQLLIALNNSAQKQGQHIIVKTLPEGHCVYSIAELLGFKLEHHLTFAEVRT